MPDQSIYLPKRRQEDCKNQKGWMTPKKQCLPGTAGLADKKLTGPTGPAQLKSDGPSAEKGKWTKLPHIIKKLSATRTHWQRENKFSPVVS